MPRLLPVLPAVLAALLACAPADRALAPAARAPRRAASASDDADVRRLRLQLEHAADGLWYTSESDVAFDYVFRPGPTPVVDAAAIRAAFGAPADAPVQAITLDDFFARHIERVAPADPVAVALVPRYRRLRETLRRGLPGVMVWRVGTIAIDCYAVGTDAAGNLVGLHTVAIET
jgi:hypothetical protein